MIIVSRDDVLKEIQALDKLALSIVEGKELAPDHALFLSKGVLLAKHHIQTTLKVFPERRKHVLTKDCWCYPTVEAVQ